jgi:hypothetical protein
LHLFLPFELRLVETHGLGLVVEVTELLLNLTDDLLSLDLLLVVAMVNTIAVLILLAMSSLKSVFSFNSSASHVPSEMGLDLSDLRLFLFMVRLGGALSTISDSGTLTIRSIIMFVLIRLTAGTTHNIFIY